MVTDVGRQTDEDGTEVVSDRWRCPACLSMWTTAVGDGADTNFLCEDCGRCWHETMGWVALVDPRSCMDCLRKPGCVAALADRR